MPRRRPADIRLDHQVAANRTPPLLHIDGLSRAGHRIVERLDADRRWPDGTLQALTHYRHSTSSDPAHRLWDDRYGCGFPECCADPLELREWLEIVVRRLRGRDRRVLRAKIDEIDALW